MKSSKTAIPLERLLEQLPEQYTLADRELVQRAREAFREPPSITGQQVFRSAPGCRPGDGPGPVPARSSRRYWVTNSVKYTAITSPW